MATGNEYNTLRDLLKAIANAIRSKVGDVGLISAQNFPSEIASIPTSSTIVEKFYKVVNQTHDGQYATVTIPEDYDVVVVSVYYPAGYDDSRATYNSKSNLHGFAYYSYLCVFYIYHGVKANSVFKDKCTPGNNAGISVLAFNAE